MPIYEFTCENCRKNFEMLCSMKTDLSALTCPHCSTGPVVKKFSTFAKGGGPRTTIDAGSDSGSSSCGSCSSGSCGTCSH